MEPLTPPRISVARLEMTSLVFMLDWVPEPVWKTTSGKWSISLPEMTWGVKVNFELGFLRCGVEGGTRTSSAAFWIASPTFGSNPYEILAIDAAFFKIPKALISGGGNRSVGPPMSKFCRDLIERQCTAATGEKRGHTSGFGHPSSGPRGPGVLRKCRARNGTSAQPA